MAAHKPAGRAGLAEAAEAVKTGAIAGAMFELCRPSLEEAAQTTTSKYIESLAALPPGTALAAGMGLRLIIALIEERGSVCLGLKLVWHWTKEKIA